MLDTDSLIALGNCSKRLFRLVDDQEVWKLLVRRIPKFNLTDIQPCRLAESNLKRLTTQLSDFAPKLPKSNNQEPGIRRIHPTRARARAEGGI